MAPCTLLQSIPNLIEQIDGGGINSAGKKKLKLYLLVAAWAEKKYAIAAGKPLVQHCLNLNTPELGHEVLLKSKGDADLESSLLMAKCQLKLKQFDAAQKTVEPFASRGESSAVAFLADIALTQRRTEDATKLLAQAIALGDKCARTKRLLASLLFEQGKIFQAHALLREEQNRSAKNFTKPLLDLFEKCEAVKQAVAKDQKRQHLEVQKKKNIVKIKNIDIALVDSSNPDEIIKYKNTSIRTVWDLSSTDVQRLGQLNAESLTLAVAMAGAVICTAEQSSIIEKISSISITPGLSQTTAYKIAANSVAVGVGAGLGNMSKSKPMIHTLAEHIGCPVDVICHPSVPSSEIIFTPNPNVSKAYGKLPLAILKSYDKIFCTYNMGNCIPPFTARQVYVQMRNHPITPAARYMPEVSLNFIGIKDFFPDITPLGQKEFITWDIGSPYRFPDSMVIGLCNSGKKGAWGNRKWHYFPELAAKLKKRGFTVRSYGVQGEYIPETDDYTNTTLRTTIESLKECSFVIASDGGLLQLADSMGIPTVSLFGPAGIIKNGPMSSFSKIITAGLPCSPCYWEKDFWTCDHTLCMKKISVEEVLKMFDELEQETRKNNNIQKNNVPPSTLSLYEKESLHFIKQLSYDISISDLEKTLFDESIALLMVNGWIRLNSFDQAKKILDLYNTISNTDLLKRKSYVERYLGNRNEEKATYHAILKKDPASIFHALKLADVYRRGREWEKHLTLMDDLISRNPDNPDLLCEKGRALLECGHMKKAKSLLSGIDSLPQSHEHVISSLDTTIFRHRGKRASIDCSSKARIAILICENEKIPNAFRSLAAYGYIYFYFPTEKKSFKTDAHCFDLVLISPQFDATEDFVPLCSCEVIPFSEHPKKWSNQALKILVDKGFTSKDKKLILLVAHHHLYRYNPHGGELSQRRIVKHLQKNGYKILVLVPNRKNDEMFCETYDGIPFLIGSHANPLDLLQWSCASYFPDLIHLYGTSSLVMTPALKQIGVPYTVFVRYWSAVSNPPYIQGKETELDKRDRIFFAPLYENAASVVANAKHTCTVVKQAFGISCEVVYAPVDPPQSPPTKPSHERTYVTLINPARGGGQFLLRNLALLLPDIPFQVYQQPTIPLPPNVVIHPYHNGDYGEMFHEARVLLVPSKEANCGVTRVLSEAYHCKTPVIAADSGAISEFLPSKFLIKPKDGVLKWAQLVRKAYNTKISKQDLETMEKALRLVCPRRQLNKVLTLVKQQLQA